MNIIEIQRDILNGLVINDNMEEIDIRLYDRHAGEGTPEILTIDLIS